MDFGVRPSEVSLFDVEEHTVPILVIERGYSSEHLVDQDSEGPPVNRVIMPSSKQHFWRNVLRSPTESVRLLGLLRETEVRQHDVALMVKQDVLRLQVSKDDVA